MPPPGATVPVFGPFTSAYRLGPLIGQGGYGEVFLGQHIRLQETVAIKIMRAEFASFHEVAARFEQEAQVLAKVRSPFIVSVRDVGTTEDGRTFVVMDWVDGESLRAILDTERMPFPEAVRIACQILQALSVAHSAGVLHRDLKPENVLLSGDDRAVRVVDFGLAKLAAEPSHTRQDFIVGTPRYMSPEQTMGQGLTPAVDLYAVGLLLFEMITGEPAAQGLGPDEWLLWHVHGRRRPLVLPDGQRAPTALSALVEKALSPMPSQRFSSADEMHGVLGAFLPRPAPPSRSSFLWPAVAIVLGVGAIGVVSSFDKPVRPPVSAVASPSPWTPSVSLAPPDAQLSPDVPWKAVVVSVSAAPSVLAPTGIVLPPPPPSAVPTTDLLAQELSVRHALAMSGSSADRLRLALILEREGKRSEAKTHAVIVVSQDPSSAAARALLARLGD